MSAPGRMICVVGPSGVGKDSVMDALIAARPDIARARRVITRAPEAGGEDYEPVTETEFAARKAQGAFLLDWPAHGLLYGLPIALLDQLNAGQDVLANLSRAVLPQAQQAVPRLEVILLSAPNDVLAERLAMRGRESKDDIARRLARAGFAMPAGVPYTEIDNSGPLDATLRALLAHLA